MTEEGCEPPRFHSCAAEFRRQGFKSGFRPGFTIKQVNDADVFFLGAAVCRVPVWGSCADTHTPVQRPEFCRECPECTDPS